MVGATVALFSRKSLTFSTNCTNSTVSEGVPWSGQDRYCICNEARVVFLTLEAEDERCQRTFKKTLALNMISQPEIWIFTHKTIHAKGD